MGVSALDYHVKGTKHQKDSEGMHIRSMFNKRLSSQLLPNKRILSIKKPQPSRVLLRLLRKDPFMCLFIKRIP